MAWLQGALAAAVLTRAATLTWGLAVVAPLEPRRFLGAVAALRRAEGEGALARLGEAAGGSWLGRVLRAFVDPASEGVDGVRLELRVECEGALAQLRGLGRLASTVGVLGALAALGWLRFADHGLAGLAAGGPEALAVSWAIAAMARGFATALFAAGAGVLLGRQAQRLLRETGALVDALEGGASP